MEPVGKVNNLAKQFSFEWEIDNFFSLSTEDVESYDSPLIEFANESWYLTVYPNGDPEDDTVGYIEVHLFRDCPGLPLINVSWSFGLKTFDGEKVHEQRHTFAFGEDHCIGYGSKKLLKRFTLLERKSELVPSNILTIVFTVHYFSKSSDDAGNTVTVECSHCKEVFVAECLSSHEQKCLDKPIRCPTCSDVVALREWFDHECQTARVKASEKVIDDLAHIFDSEKYSDVIIKVKDREFRLHRSILAARNAYFSSMFNTDMKEKATGIVFIDDCEPNIFYSFIHFVYTGKLQPLSYDNVCALYKVADKYQEDQLKAECLCFMKNKMSIDSLCDFIVLALMHDEKELLQIATQLFCKQTKEIIQSVKWQTFMREYPMQANEFLTKIMDDNCNEDMECSTNCE